MRLKTVVLREQTEQRDRALRRVGGVGQLCSQLSHRTVETCCFEGGEGGHCTHRESFKARWNTNILGINELSGSARHYIAFTP